MAFNLVLFGGTGDLAWRKLMPALFQAFRHGSLPEGGRIMGVARDEMSDAQYRELIRNRFDQVDLAKRPSSEEFERFASLLHYQRMDLSKPEAYALLKTRLEERPADTTVMYLAVSPHLFNNVAQQLGAALRVLNMGEGLQKAIELACAPAQLHDMQQRGKQWLSSENGAAHGQQHCKPDCNYFPFALSLSKGA